MLTRADIPLLLTAGLKTNFMTGLNALGTTVWDKITTEVPSNKDKETYAWLGSTPQLREWTDERAPKALLEHGFTVINKDWETTIAVDRNALDDDQYGQTYIRAQQLGEAVNKGKDRLISQMIEAGHTTLCYDGQYFFDTDHSEGSSGTQVNYFNGASYVFGSAAIKEAMSAMENFKDDVGNIMGYSATHVMVPSGLYWTAKELLDPSAVIATTDPTKKVLSGVLQIIKNPYLATNGTAANSAWYLLDLSTTVKPFIFQNRQAPRFTPLDKPDSYDNFMRKKIYYGVDLRFAFGFGDWRGAIRLGNT